MYTATEDVYKRPHPDRGLAQPQDLRDVGDRANGVQAVSYTHLVDLPGYGYARVSQAEKERWATLMERSFQEEADRITTGVLIVDIRHKPTANDLVMHDWFRQTGCPEIVVANKLDKLKKSQVEPALQLVREKLAPVSYTDLPARRGAYP